MNSSQRLGGFLTLACVVAGIKQVTTAFSATNNPTYSGTEFTLTCQSTGDSSKIAKIKISCQSSSCTELDVIQCNTLKSATTATGLFTQGVKIACSSSALSVSLIANSNSAGLYQCRFSESTDGTSETTLGLTLTVLEAPSRPQIGPSVLVYNESDQMFINCTSTGGDPPAEVELSIFRNSTMPVNYTATASNTVLLRLNATTELHNAIATCRVKNYQLTNMTATTNIIVNYIVLRPGANASQNALDSDVLNCSTFVDSFPPPVFAWSALSNSSTSVTPAGSEILRPVGYAGVLKCTATNSLLRKKVSVTFQVNKAPPTTPPVTSVSHTFAPEVTTKALTNVTALAPQFSSTQQLFTSGTVRDATTSASNSYTQSTQLSNRSTSGSVSGANITSASNSIAPSTQKSILSTSGTVRGATITSANNKYTQSTQQITRFTSGSNSDANITSASNSNTPSTQQSTDFSSGSGSDANITSASSNNITQNNEPLIIGITVFATLLSAAVAVIIVVLRYCRKSLPTRKLPSSQSTCKIIRNNSSFEIQGDSAENSVHMSSNRLYDYDPAAACAEHRPSIIYAEPYHHVPVVSSSTLATSQEIDSPSISIRIHERNLLAEKRAENTQNGDCQREGAAHYVDMTSNDLYETSLSGSANYPPSVIYAEPSYQPSIDVVLKHTSQDKDSPRSSIRTHERESTAGQRTNDNSDGGHLTDRKTYPDAGEESSSDPLDVSSTAHENDSRLQDSDTLAVYAIPQRSSTTAKLLHDRNVENMLYMEIQPVNRESPKELVHEED